MLQIKEIMMKPKLSEPLAIDCSSTDYNIQLTKALNWYNYEKDKKEGHAYLRNYIIKKYGREPLKTYDRIPLQKMIATYMWLAQLFNNGSKLNENHQTSLDKYVDELLQSERSTENISQPKVTPKVSIQDSINQKIPEVLGLVEGELDKMLFNGEDVDFYKFLKSNEIPQVYFSHIETFVKSKIDEYQEVQSSDDEQIKEGYSNFTKRRFSKVLDHLAKWVTAIQQYNDFKKANRKPRAKKEKSPSLQVAKLSFKKEDDELKLKSIAPTDIVGASQVWIYNTKYKKLTVYRSDSAKGIQVKGTTLQNYDPDLCEQKTLRKPAEVIKQVLSGGKIQLRKILSNLSTKNSPVNGRINDECILLRAIK